MQPWECRGAALWVRVWLYARAHHGVALRRGELRGTLDPLATPADISRAITRCKTEGVLTHDSTARALYSLTGKDIAA